MSAVLLADVKAHLNITVATYDAELQAHIDAAEGTIAAKVGPLSPTSVTDRLEGCYERSLVLTCSPVVSLTSVKEVLGATLNLSDLYLDAPAGIVRWVDSVGLFGALLYDVTYMAGRSSLPADLALAVKEQVRHTWRSQRGGTQRPGTTPDTATAAAGLLAPSMVAELIEPYLTSNLGFA